MKLFLSILFVSLFSSLSFANNGIIDFSKGPGKVQFLAVGRPSALKIKGEGGKTEGQLKVSKEVISGKLNFNLSSLKTGIDLRDEHMKDKYLEVNKHPQATLEIKDLKMPKLPATDLAYTADLTIRGVTKSVPAVANIEQNGKNFKLKSEFKIKVSDFNIEIPKYAGITVADEVTVTVEAEPEWQSSK